MSNSPNRSFEIIDVADLQKLSNLANDDLNDLFERKRSGVYARRCMFMGLCQGAAQHFVHRDRGVNDFDVWAFFRSHPDRAFPHRRIGRKDFGPSRFGRNPDDKPRFRGRRVDVIGRSISVVDAETGVEAVQRYLRAGQTTSARLIAERPVVAIWPFEILGNVIWQPIAASRSKVE